MWKEITTTHEEEHKKNLHQEQLSSMARWNLLSYVAGSPNSQSINLERELSELSDELLAGR
ncbi:unnamed protein product [Brassica napus]|uniref:(rape) hypothetical protein n=1 Tax=Brassica napus TaxID=3708 RepID=A0A816XMN8_BRANA|nr:unnamed protein product [Brassica napus]